MACRPLFEKAADYVAFETVLAQTHERFPMRILAYPGLFTTENTKITE